MEPRPAIMATRGRARCSDEDLIESISRMSISSSSACDSCGPKFDNCYSRLDSKAKQFVKTRDVRQLQVERVPGIGPAIGERLRQDRVKTTGDLLVQLDSRGKRGFEAYIGDCGGNTSHQRKALQGLQDWSIRNGGQWR